MSTFAAMIGHPPHARGREDRIPDGAGVLVQLAGASAKPISYTSHLELFRLPIVLPRRMIAGRSQMSQTESQQRTTHRRACNGAPTSAHRRVPTAIGRDVRDLRRARSEARAAEGVINAYARGVATARAPQPLA